MTNEQEPERSVSAESEYRARIVVDVVILPDPKRGVRHGSPDARAVMDACDVKSYLEDPEIQNRIDESGSRGRIIGACVQDVRRVDFAEPLPVDEILAADLQRRLEECS